MRRPARRVCRVAVVTGTRAEYGLLRSTLRAIDADPGLRLQLIVTGMHLLPRFGNTWKEITADGFRIDARVAMQRGDDTAADQAHGLARGVAGIADALIRLKSDVALVLGDRIEAVAAALAANATGRRLAHVHGGDVAPGDRDDRYRNAISQLADLHLAASRDARNRLMGMGIAPGNIVVVGAPGLDEIRGIRLQKNSGSDTAIVVQHAYGRPAAIEERVMRMLLTEVRRTGLRSIVLYPNSDRGSAGVIRAIEADRRSDRDGQIQRSLERSEFLTLLADARLLVGNSSTGIIEAPLLGVPSVNVGDRQCGRLPGGGSIIHAQETVTGIRAALKRAMRLKARPSRRGPYGDGRAGERIARAIASLLR